MNASELNPGIASIPIGLTRGAIFDRLISAGMPVESANRKTELFQKLLNEMAQDGARLSDSTSAWFVPGRIEFLGKHTDYLLGRSLLCAIDRGLCIIASPRADSVINIHSSRGSTSFEISPALQPSVGQWTNYPMTVARRLARNFPGRLNGADIYFTSDLPESSGMSSSSAVVVGLFLVIAEVNELQQRSEYRQAIGTDEELAEYLGTIENGRGYRTLAGDRGVGTFGGSEDHTAILLSKPNCLRQFSFGPTRLERTITLPKDHVFVIGVSGVIAEKTGAARAAFNESSALATSIMQIWSDATDEKQRCILELFEQDRIRQLREIIARSEGKEVAARRLDRLDQFIVECTKIIPESADAIEKGVLESLGQCVDLSQELAERLLGNQVPETIFLARSARETGAVAASAFGAGFGGSVWALVRAEKADQLIENWRARYVAAFPLVAGAATFFKANAGPAALRL